jgi:hypothetical protein
MAANQSVTNCYNTAPVSGTAASASGVVRAGGILGQAAAATTAIINCYFLDGSVASNVLYGTGTAPRVDGSESRATATPVNSSPVRINGTSSTDVNDQWSGVKITGQMKPLGSMSLTDIANGLSIYYTGTTTVGTETVDGWDFTTTWHVDATINGGYPILRATFLSVSSVDDPEDQHVFAGGRAKFSASAGTAEVMAPFTSSDMLPQYQWYEDIGGTRVLISGAIGKELILENITAADNGRKFVVSVRPAGYNNSDEVFSDVATLYVFFRITVTSNDGGYHQYRLQGNVGWRNVADGTVAVPVGSSVEIRGVAYAKYGFSWNEDIRRDHSVNDDEILSFTPNRNGTVSGTFTPITGDDHGNGWLILFLVLLTFLILLLLGYLSRNDGEEGGKG